MDSKWALITSSALCLGLAFMIPFAFSHRASPKSMDKNSSELEVFPEVEATGDDIEVDESVFQRTQSVEAHGILKFVGLHGGDTNSSEMALVNVSGGATPVFKVPEVDKDVFTAWQEKNMPEKLFKDISAINSQILKDKDADLIDTQAGIADLTKIVVRIDAKEWVPWHKDKEGKKVLDKVLLWHKGNYHLLEQKARLFPKQQDVTEAWETAQKQWELEATVKALETTGMKGDYVGPLGDVRVKPKKADEPKEPPIFDVGGLSNYKKDFMVESTDEAEKVEVDGADQSTKAAETLLQKFLGYEGNQAKFAVQSLLKATPTGCTLTVCREKKPFKTLLLRADFVQQKTGNYYLSYPKLDLTNAKDLLKSLWLRWSLRPEKDEAYQLAATLNINELNIKNEYKKVKGYSVRPNAGGEGQLEKTDKLWLKKYILQVVPPSQESCAISPVWTLTSMIAACLFYN